VPRSGHFDAIVPTRNQRRRLHGQVTGFSPNLIDKLASNEHMPSAKVAVLALSILCLPSSPQSNQSISTISWSEMIWGGLTTNGQNIPHAALLVDVRLDSLGMIPASMQLDTGANQDILYMNTYKELQPKETPGDKNWVGLSGSVAGRAFRGDWFAHSDQGGPILPGKKPLLGTVGAAFFERRILVLDFVAQRLAILGQGKDLPSELDQRVEYVPLEYRNGKMFVVITLNGVEERDMFFDTGSSAMAVSTTRQHWRELTGKQLDDPRNSEILGETWGKPARWLGAPLKGTMSLGKLSLSQPVIYCEPTGTFANFDFDKYPFKTSGHFGNVPFDERFTVIVDLPHKRFGIFEGSLAGQSLAGK
jgi:hypothetical protein